MGRRQHFASVAVLAGVMAPGVAGAGDGPPVSISLHGADAITERACTGPFTATLRSADSRAVASSSWSYFWVELEGAAPEWTAFYEDESCRRRVQSYTDNRGDGRSKARLDFKEGVSQREFYVLAKKLVSNTPTIRVTPRSGSGSDSSWQASKNLDVTIAPSVAAVATLTSSTTGRRPTTVPSSAVGVAQNSLERAARLGPLHAFNNWRPKKPVVERFDIESAVIWRDELIVRSERLVNHEPACSDAATECATETGFLSAISLATGEPRRLLSWSLGETQAVGSTRDLIRQRISGDKLLLQYGTNPARVMVVDLLTGDTVSSGPLDLRIDDFAVHGQHVVLIYFDTTKRAGAIQAQRTYYAGYYRLDDFGFVNQSWMGARPIATEDTLYSRLVGLSDGESNTVLLTPQHADGSKGERLEGAWPKSHADCRAAWPDRILSSPRFYVEIDRCGTVRAIDLQERGLFHLPWSMNEQFTEPTYALSKDNLIVQGQLKQANRGAGDSGHPLYVFDLVARKWRGRLHSGGYSVVSPATDRNAVVLSLTRGCANKYGSGTSAGVLKSPVVVRRLQLLADDEIGSSGLEIARAYRDKLTRGKLDRLGRFGAQAEGLRALLASTPDVGPRAAALNGHGVTGALSLRNSPGFRERLQYPRPVSLSEAAQSPYACELLDIPTYALAGGDQVGWMSLTIRPGRVEGSVVDGWMADMKQQRLVPAPVVYRDKYRPTLSIYEVADRGWVRLTTRSEPALWVDARSLPADMAASVASR